MTQGTLVLCDNLEVWDGVGVGGRATRRDICLIHFCMAEKTQY